MEGVNKIASTVREATVAFATKDIVCYLMVTDVKVINSFVILGTCISIINGRSGAWIKFRKIVV